MYKMSETETSTKSDDSAQLLDSATSGRTGKSQYRVTGNHLLLPGYSSRKGTHRESWGTVKEREGPTKRTADVCLGGDREGAKEGVRVHLGSERAHSPLLSSK